MIAGKRVFVSGGAGVIGRELVPRLVQAGATVLVGDLKPRPAELAGVSYRQGDLNELAPAELEAFAPEVFIHLAATFERTTESYEFWHENDRHNVRLSHHLMTLHKDLPSLRKVVFASSYLIYDSRLYNFSEEPAAPRALRESDPITPRNLTGMAKLAHEVELEFLAKFLGDRVAIVSARIFRGYGRGSRDVISRWVRAALAGEELTVYRPEGRFDYVYAADTAEGLLRLAAHDGARGIVNLGPGNARRVAEVVEALRTRFPSLRVREAPSDIPYEASQADTTRLRELLGWVPSTPLEDALDEIVAYERARGADKAATAGHVLISSASKKVPLVLAAKRGAAKVSPDVKVLAGDLDRDALAQHVADGFVGLPRTTHDNVDAIASLCAAHGIGLVIPTRDGELRFWAAHRDHLAARGITVMVSPVEAIDRCVDKLFFARFCREHGIPAIPTVTEPDELSAPLYVVKDRFGAGSRTLGLKLDLPAARAHAQTLDHPIVQPFIEGRELSADVYVTRAGDVRGPILRWRDVVVHGESVITTTFRDEELEATIAHAARVLGIRGHAVLQALIDPAGGQHLIECNARFGGASTLSVAAGLDTFTWAILEAQGDDLAAHPFLRARGELRQVRVPSDIIRSW